jgi:hypothetical protein
MLEIGSRLTWLFYLNDGALGLDISQVRVAGTDCK